VGKGSRLLSRDLLPEFLYADWPVAGRERLAQLYESALLHLAEQRLDAASYGPALEACRQLLARAPWHEQATLTGMRASVALNDRAGALRLFRNLEKALCDEFDVAPSPDLLALYDEIAAASTPREDPPISP